MTQTSDWNLPQLLFELVDSHFVGLGVLLVIIVFRKQIGGLVQRVTKLFVNAPGGYSAGLDAIPQGTEQDELGPSGISKTVEAGDTTDDEEQEHSDNEQKSLWHAVEAIGRGEIVEAKEIFDVCQKEVDDPNQRHANEAFFLHELYTEGGENDALARLIRLRTTSTGDFQIRTATLWLAYSYAAANDYKNEGAAWREGIDAVQGEEAKTELIEGLARTYSRQGDGDRGIQLLERRLIEVSSDKLKSSIYKAIADLLKENDREIDAAVALEKSVEHSPGDKQKLFDAAYLQSQQRLRVVSIANYQTLLNLDARHATALNNLGVSASEFKIRSKENELYKKAANLGSTLAMANLANNQIKAGFCDEAEEILNTARTSDDPHENVGQAMYRLEATREEEREKWTKINLRCLEVQRRVRQYGENLFAVAEQAVDCSGDWYTSKGNKVEVRIQDGGVWGEWSENRGALPVAKYNCSISGKMHNRSVRVQYVARPKEERLSGLLHTREDVHIECLSYFSGDLERWTFFSVDPENELEFEFVRTKPQEE